MSETLLLLVDDEESFRKLVGKELARVGYAVEMAGTLDEARRVLAQRAFHLVLLDVRLPDGSGLDLLTEIKEISPTTAVIMLTAYGTVQEAIRALKDGAHDFLTKPCKLGELEAVLEKAVQRQSLERGNVALQRDVDRLHPSEHFIGASPQIRDLLKMVTRVAGTDSTVLIRGESGVGKELVARAVHRHSRRARQPFVVVDCASLHENLLQSELFGHEKGAYTGAVRLKHGLFEVADRGTIFLDEIGEITPPLQVKLLRVLESGTFRRVGGTADIKVDVRVITATNRSLETMMKDGQFREDLYYRLNVFPIDIPPLRERREDIPVLAKFYLARYNRAFSRNFREVSFEALQLMEGYGWPGNIRELKNVIERAIILENEETLLLEHLPQEIVAKTAGAGAGSGGFRLPPEGIDIEDVERELIRQALEMAEGNQSKAAKKLSLGIDAFRYRMKKFGYLK